VSTACVQLRYVRSTVGVSYGSSFATRYAWLPADVQPPLLEETWVNAGVPAYRST
jgi:hypothetical protein